MPTYTRSRSSLDSNSNKNNSSSVTKDSQDMSASQLTGKLEEKQGSVGSGQSSLSSSGSDSEARLLASNADYDHVRNTTLMFFLDRLFIASKDGKEARTLHDLSCLFGNKDFTKEMRQIVGASRNGLRKFLQSYPSLFTIDGDKVYLTQLEQETSGGTYNKEAVEYFTNKLLQFGSSLVPIKNLFGYRSQARQEVRHVSGKNIIEFKQFLSSNSNVFEILPDEEHVILKSALKELESRGEPLHSSLQLQVGRPDEKAIIDPYLNKRFAHSIEDSMRQMLLLESNNTEHETTGEHTTSGRIEIERLHEKIMKDCNNHVFLKMVNTIDDLRMFLRMHPKLFKRYRCQDQDDHREYVSLLTEQERLEFEQQAYPSLGARQNSTLRRTNTNDSQDLSSLSGRMSLISQSNKEDDLANGPESLPAMPAVSHNPASLSQLSNDKPSVDPTSGVCVKKSGPETSEAGGEAKAGCKSAKQPNASLLSKPTSQQQPRAPLTSTKSLASGTALRATAPPFVPSSSKSSQSPQNQHSNSSSTTPTGARLAIQRSVSNLSPHPPAIDQRKALRSYLLKASAGNNSGPYSLQKPANGAHYISQSSATPIVHPNQQRASTKLSQLVVGAQDSDDIRARTINVVKEASSIISRIMSSTDAVAFDCKGYNLGFNGQITLIQFAFLPNDDKLSATSAWASSLQQHSQRLNLTTNHESNQKENQEGGKSGERKPEVCVFDLITNPELAYCLKPLLESEQIVKIVHDVRNKSNALYVQFGIMLNYVFDTQVANLVIQQQDTGKPVYKSRYISMSKLCEVYGDESLIKYRNLIKMRTRHSSNSSRSSSKIKDVNYWRTRPLTDPMVCEAIMDVYCLIGGVYQKLKTSIQPEYQPLFEQLNLEGVLARIKPDEIRSVKKERKIDLEVIDLKRKLYSDSTNSIVLSNREVRLLRHIDLTEEVRQKIQQCKKVDKKLERLDMKAAQNQLQSLNGGQLSTDDGELSLDPQASLQTNGASLSSLQSSGGDHSSQAATRASQEAADKLNDEVETGMSYLMDSSMFDELKDKMIESSSLLDSLSDDDDDDNNGNGPGRLPADGQQVDAPSSRHSHSGSHPGHKGDEDDHCRCNCHRGSLDVTSQTTSADKAAPNSLKSFTSSASTDKEDASMESRAVDMAVQCDLLS